MSLDELATFYEARQKLEWAYAFYDFELELRKGLASPNAAALEKLRTATEALKTKLGDSAEAASLLRSVRQGTFVEAAATRLPAEPSSTCWTSLVAEISRDEAGGATHFLIAKAGP